MRKDQLAVLRGRPATRNAPPADTLTSTRRGAESLSPHPLSIVALASSIRLDDPRNEHERVVMLEVAILAGREAARELDRWLSQTLAEYRGSRTAWDLEATTADLRLKLDQFDEILRDTADRLIALVPGLIDGMPGFASLSPSKPRRRQVLDEVAAVSRLLDAIEASIGAASVQRDDGRRLPGRA